jgi:hypothetical protein
MRFSNRLEYSPKYRNSRTCGDEIRETACAPYTGQLAGTVP